MIGLLNHDFVAIKDIDTLLSGHAVESAAVDCEPVAIGMAHAADALYAVSLIVEDDAHCVGGTAEHAGGNLQVSLVGTKVPACGERFETGVLRTGARQDEVGDIAVSRFQRDGTGGAYEHVDIVAT